MHQAGRQRPNYLHDDELTRLIRATRDRRHRNAVRDRAILALLGNCGMRPGELTRLRTSDLHLGSKPWVRVRRLKKRSNDTGAIDDVPLPDPLARLLRGYIRSTNPSDWLFPAMRATSHPLTVRSLERLFLFYARRAGLQGAPNLYSLRHTAARRLYQACRDLRLVQRMLGHADSHTTEIYTHVDLEQCYSLYDKLGTVI